MTTTDADSSIDWFNTLPGPELETLLASCLDVPRWMQEMVDGRPYADVDQLLARARASAASLTTPEVDTALSRHPRIGERAGAEHDAEFSAAEQSGVDRSNVRVARALELGNAAYEERFDRVFLIRAAGRSAEEILAELDRRLNNSDKAEYAEVVSQLREIAILRLEQVISR